MRARLYVNRLNGVKPRVIKQQYGFSINRKGNSVLYDGVSPKAGGLQAHWFGQMFGELQARHCNNLANDAATLDQTLAGVIPELETLVKYYRQSFKMRNNFSQPNEVRVFLCYPRRNMNAEELSATTVAGAPALSHGSYVSILCPTPSNNSTEQVPGQWPTLEAHAHPADQQDNVQGKPYLWEWDPRKDAPFTKWFKVKMVKHRKLQPGEEMSYSYATKNLMWSKKKWGISVGLNSFGPSLPILRKGYPMLLISVRGSMVHDEFRVGELAAMSNWTLYPTYGDFNLDVLWNHTFSAQIGGCRDWQAYSAYGQPFPYNPTVNASMFLDQYTSDPVSEQAGTA